MKNKFKKANKGFLSIFLFFIAQNISPKAHAGISEGRSDRPPSIPPSAAEQERMRQQERQRQREERNAAGARETHSAFQDFCASFSQSAQLPLSREDIFYGLGLVTALFHIKFPNKNMINFANYIVNKKITDEKIFNYHFMTNLINGYEYQVILEVDRNSHHLARGNPPQQQNPQNAPEDQHNRSAELKTVAKDEYQKFCYESKPINKDLVLVSHLLTLFCYKFPHRYALSFMAKIKREKLQMYHMYHPSFMYVFIDNIESKITLNECQNIFFDMIFRDIVKDITEMKQNKNFYDNDYLNFEYMIVKNFIELKEYISKIYTKSWYSILRESDKKRIQLLLEKEETYSLKREKSFKNFHHYLIKKEKDFMDTLRQ